MTKKIQSVRGMHDCLPKDTVLWRRVEQTLSTILNNYGYNEIRFPVVEYTNLFKRSIGEITDVVEKEMYSFNDRNGSSLTLRPEGTSGCVRSGIENELFYHQLQRLWYTGPMFRRERPQKGRYRQFHQFSAESFGQVGPEIDVELILITTRFWKALGINDYLLLELNTIGSLDSRILYKKDLISFLEKNKSVLDVNSIRRLYSNPMRILDSKNEKVKELLCYAPKLFDYLDNFSRSHFSELCRLLDICKITYDINPYLVRGLDYYNYTVFEWVSDKLGSQKTVCAGGRYDNLVKQLGGENVPAVGFSVGLERIILLMQIVNNLVFCEPVYIDIYIVNIGYSIHNDIIIFSEYIRESFLDLRIVVNYSDCHNSLKKQFLYSDKNHVHVLLIIDKIYFCKKEIILKDLYLGKQEIVEYNDVIKKLKNIFF